MPLPFTRAEFLHVFAVYNGAIWPLQIIAAALGLLAVGLLFSRSARTDRAVSAILSFFWAVTGAGYHWMSFTPVNRAAYLFGTLFILMAAVLLVEGTVRNRIRFGTVSGARAWIAALLIAYSFAVYPLIGLLVTHPYPETPLFGVTPCPTTIFTLGILLLGRHPNPLVLAVIPLVWSLIGGSAAILLAIPQDWGLLAAAAAWIIGAAVASGERSERRVV